jgi:hypothetical protein
MQINENLGNNAYRKIAKLLTKAVDLEMDLSGHGEASENPTSGCVFLWLEDYPFTLFIGLGAGEVEAVWSDPVNGEETIIEVGNMSLESLESWAYKLENQAQGVQ